MAEFVLPEKTGTIVIDEGDYAGAEAVVRTSGRLAPYWELRRLMARDGAETEDEKQAKLEQLYELAARDVFVSWNVADQTGPLPITPDGLARCDPELFALFIGLWAQSKERVTPPLGKPSTGGAPSARRKTTRKSRRS